MHRTEHNGEDLIFPFVSYQPEKKTEGKPPLIIQLHGAGERGEGGEELSLVDVHGFSKTVKDGDFEAVFVMPQCPKNSFWAARVESILKFIEQIKAEYGADEDRVYLTGLSMGGTGTWMLAMADNERFAAIAPICGSGIYWNGDALKNIPVFVYHGDCDEAVPIQDSIEMIKSVNRNGGHAEIKVLYGVGHNAWDVAYSGDELYKWLLSHKRAEK